LIHEAWNEELQAHSNPLASYLSQKVRREEKRKVVFLQADGEKNLENRQIQRLGALAGPLLPVRLPFD
jgi:hypothetical protein